MASEELKSDGLVWPRYVLVYGMWLLTLGLGIWTLLVSRDAVIEVASRVFVQTSSARAWRISAVEKYYALGAGFVWLGLMVFSEHYFRNGVTRGHLLPRIARVFGAELLTLFVFDVVLFFTQGLPSGAWTRWLLLGVELAGGVACVMLARTSPRMISDIKTDDPV